MSDSSVDVTRLLKAFSDGDVSARDRLFELVYRDLRVRAGAMMRRERPDHTLQPTALINEAYLRLVKTEKVDWQNREHFFKVATEVMRHLLIDSARKRAAEKRGSFAGRVSLDDVDPGTKGKDVDLLALNDALIEFEQIDPVKSDVVKLQFFGGFSNDEIADIKQVSVATIKRHKKVAFAWLRSRMEAS